MQVESILPVNIQHQLQGSLDPLEMYINGLLDEHDEVFENRNACYSNKRTILASQEIERVDLNPSFVNTLQLLRLNASIDKNSSLYQSILKQIDLYFLTGRVKDE